MKHFMALINYNIFIDLITIWVTYLGCYKTHGYKYLTSGTQNRPQYWRPKEFPIYRYSTMVKYHSWAKSHGILGIKIQQMTALANTQDSISITQLNSIGNCWTHPNLSPEPFVFSLDSSCVSYLLIMWSYKNDGRIVMVIVCPALSMMSPTSLSWNPLQSIVKTVKSISIHCYSVKSITSVQIVLWKSISDN